MYFLILCSYIIFAHSFVAGIFFSTEVKHFSLASFSNSPSCKKLESLECKRLEDRSGSLALIRWRIFRPAYFHHQILPPRNHLKKINLHFGVTSVQLQSGHRLQNAFTFPQFYFSAVEVGAIGQELALCDISPHNWYSCREPSLFLALRNALGNRHPDTAPAGRS